MWTTPTDEDEETITREEYLRRVKEYWSKVEESEGFDIEGIIQPPFCTGLRRFDCQRGYYPRTLVKRYAFLGLHRYNMLQGTNFILSALVKYNMLANCVSSYYMTLVAIDLDSGLQKFFQVRLDEQKFGILDLTIAIARPKEEVPIKKPFVPHFHGDAAVDDGHLKGELPDWPSDDAFNDTNRFYMVKKSEWEDSDWISLYLELTVVACNRFILLEPDQESILANLKILKVAIETSEDVDEKLKAKSAHVYITFKGLAETRERVSLEIGEHVVRRVIVRRVLNEDTGYLSLLGKFRSGNNNAEQSSVTLGTGEEPLQRSKKRSRLV